MYCTGELANKMLQTSIILVVVMFVISGPDRAFSLLFDFCTKSNGFCNKMVPKLSIIQFKSFSACSRNYDSGLNTPTFVIAVFFTLDHNSHDVKYTLEHICLVNKIRAYFTQRLTNRHFVTTFYRQRDLYIFDNRKPCNRYETETIISVQFVLILTKP